MPKDLSSKKEFEESTDRTNQEKRELIKNLSPEKKKYYEDLKLNKKKERKDTRNRQEKNRPAALAKERQKIIERKPKLVLQPSWSKEEVRKKDIERRAIRAVAGKNRQEIAALDKKHRKEMDKFLASERIGLEKEFNRERGEGRER